MKPRDPDDFWVQMTWIAIGLWVFGPIAWKLLVG